MDLQETLRSLCIKTGWCYAVFWKLKRRSRMVLTWEDGYYEYAKSSAVCEQFAADSRLRGGNGCLESGGNPLDQGSSGHEASYPQGQIGLAVAKMSYYVYSMGEGIIGRVAFTGKHQWVFGAGENNCVEAAPGGVLNNRCMLEKYLAGWQNQFAAGIKTIAVIAVAQGVVQLGSTQMILEDPKWVDHIKSVFGTLQSVRGAFASDLFTDGQGGKPVTCVRSAESPSAVPARTTTFDRVQCCLGNVKNVNATPLQPFVYGSTGRPSFVKDLANIQGLQSRAEDTGAAKAMLQESAVQQAMETGTETHVSKSTTTHSGTQNLQLYSPMVPLNLPPNVNKIIPLPSDDMGTCHLTDVEEMLLKKNLAKEFHSPSSLAFVTGIGTENDAGAFMSPHSDILPDVSCNQEMPSVNGMVILEKISNFKMNESLLGDNAVNDQQQQKVTPLNVLTRAAGHKVGFSTRAKLLPTESHPCKLLKCDMVNEILNLPSPDEGNLSIQVGCRDIAQTADAAWSLPSKHMKSNVFNGVGIAGTVQDPVCSIIDQDAWDHDGLLGSTSISFSQSRVGHVESSCRDLEPNLMSNKSLATGCFVDFEDHSPPFSVRQFDCSFAIGDELSQALGPGFRKGHSKELWEEILLHSCGDQLKEAPNQRTLRGSSQLSEPDVATTWGPSLVEDNLHNGFGLHFSENRLEPLLDAVVGNASSSHHSISTNADSSFSGKTTFSVLDNGKSVLNSIKDEDKNHAAQEFFIKGYVQDCKATVDVHNISQISDAKGHPHFHLLSTWIDEGKSIKSDTTEPSQTRKPEELTKASRKRSRPGESTRPRPKDRQQIQDRVRELRGIVPNGSKCSIDALLEKTIRHMVFLQTVSRHADKLKKDGEFKDDMESGASWALDFGGQETGCPILVENLSQPHQMLVEVGNRFGGQETGCPILVENLSQPHQMLVQMLCEERGLFLEIAERIRNLGLTILKGVMESRVEKVWARFIVEANKDVQRVDVLLSLMRLLHPNNSSSSSMTTASQSGLTRSQQGINSSSSQTHCGFQQSSFSA